MRFEHLSLRGLGPFRDAVELDLSAIPGPLVAITGGNGAGKSTLLELLMGALDRETPTRGTLAELATTRDAYVEARFVNGAAWTIRQTVDATSGKGEALVLDASGAPALADAKVRSFDAWRLAHLPPREVLFASVFAAQGSGGFLEMKAGERKSLLLRTLGIESLEGNAERAREHLRTAKTALQLVLSRTDDVRQRARDAASIDAEIAEERKAVGVATSAVDDARAAERQAEASAADAGEALREHQRRVAEAKELRARADALDIKVADLGKRLENNRAVLHDAEAIRSAVEEAREAQRLLTETTLDAGRERGFAEQAERDLKRVEASIVETNGAIAAIERRVERALGVLRDRARILAAMESMADLEQAVAEAALASDAAHAEVERLRARRLAGAEDRIKDLRGSLTAVAHVDPTQAGGALLAREIATKGIATDDAVLESAARAPEELRAAERAAIEARRAYEAKARAKEDARQLAQRWAEIARAEEDKTTAEAELREARSRIVDLEPRGIEFARDVETHRQALAEARQRMEAAERRKAELDPFVKRSEPLAKAEGRIAELLPQIEEATNDAAQLRARADEIAPAGDAPTTPDLATARALVETKERELRAIETRVAVLEKDLEQARADAVRLAELDAERAAAEAVVADWTLLADSLGKDGLQALIIDAAGPEITEICNSLLHEAFGTRFTISLDTTKRSADGKREIEVMDVNVIDTERGRDGKVDALSGGEKVIVGEALSLALATLACRQSGLERPSIIRDESGAALDPENSLRYVAMLRRASALIGADKVYLVSHSQAVQEMCDARIEVRDGKVEVRT